MVPPDAVLTWNTYAVNAVRASTPTKVQTDGMVYMSYVQAAVYDAVTKLEGRYEPYHDFSFAVVPGASVQAAVAAASHDDARPLPARPAADSRRGVRRLHRNADGRRRRTASRSARPRRTTSSRSAPATVSTRRRRATEGSGRSCPASGSCSRARRCRRRGSRRCARSCSSGPRSSAPSRRPR